MKKLLSIGLMLFLCACTTIIESDKTKSLVVSNKMDKSIFLVPVTPSQRTVFIDIRNFTDYTFFDISSPVQSLIRKKGYKVVQDPSLAHFMIQANITAISKTVSENKQNYNISTDLKVSQRIPESIYIRKLQETAQSKEDFTKMSFSYDDYEVTETLANDDKTSLFWKTYHVKIATSTNQTELTFDEIASIVIDKISDVIVSVF